MEVERESRSRSRTPFVGDAVEMDNASTTETATRKTRRTEKPKPTNGLSNGSPDKTESVTTITTETVSVTVNETKAAKDIVNRSKAKPAVKKVTSTEKEVINKKLVEKNVTSKKTVQKEEMATKKKAASHKSLMETSDYSSDEEGKMRTINTYKAAGDWWETFPKTDFVYSPASRFRNTTVAPGVKAMPNMSRRSLRSVGASSTTSESAFETRTSNSPNPLYNPRWLPGHATLSRYSDAESEGEDVCVSRTATTTTTTATTISVWTRITTVVVTALGVFSPPVRWLLDWFYLAVAYVRVLDTRILAAIPRRPRREMAALLFVPLLLAFALWLAASAHDAPLVESSALIGQWLVPALAFFRPSTNERPTFRVTPPIVPPATPLPQTERHQQTSSRDHHATTAHVDAASRQTLDLDAIAARVAQSAALRQAVDGAAQELRSEAESWRAAVNADWQRHEESRQAASLELSSAQLDALAERLATNGKLSATLLANGKLLEKLATSEKLVEALASGRLLELLLANGDLADKLAASGATPRDAVSDEELVERLLAKLLLDGRLTQNLLVNGELVHKLVVSGELANKLLSNGDVIERLLADGEFAARLVADGGLAERLLARGEISAKILDNGEIVKRLSTDGTLLSRLLADGKLADGILADRRLVEKLVEGGLASRLVADGELAKTLLGEGGFVASVLADGGLVARLIADGALKGELAERLARDGRLSAAVLGDAEFSARVDSRTQAAVAEALATDERLASLVAINGRPAEDARVTDLQVELAALAANFNNVLQQLALLKQRPASDSAVAVPADVRSLVASMIARYDADKTGRADFALESNGGSVLSTRCSETHTAGAASITLLGVPLWTESSNPRKAIQPGTLPGQCWAFKGARGFLVVQLSGEVNVTDVSIEHMPRELSRDERIASAPRRMTLLGLATLEDPAPLLLAKFEFLAEGPSLQTFPVTSDVPIPPLRIVELQIESNHGHQEYTCLYRFRVHGKLVGN